MESHKPYTLNDLEKRLGKKLSETDTERLQSLLEKKALEVGEIASQDQRAYLDILLTKVQETFALNQTDIESIVDELLKTEKPKPIQENNNKFYEGLIIGAVGTGAIALGVILGTLRTSSYETEMPLTEQEQLGPIFSYTGDVIAEKRVVILKGIPEYDLPSVKGLEDYFIRVKFKEGTITLKEYGEPSYLDCLDNAIKSGDKITIETPEVYSSQLFQALNYSIFISNSETISINGKPIPCFIN